MAAKKKKTTKPHPSWKSENARTHRSRLQRMADGSVSQVHRGATVIVEQCTVENDDVSQEDKLDIVYALDLMSDCMGILQNRLQRSKNKTKKKTRKRR